MKLLLDTHVVIWWAIGDSRLSDQTAELIEAEPAVYLSAASMWEIAIKMELGKIKGPEWLPELTGELGFRSLPITPEHAIVAARLAPIHRDPFDRMLVAQARCEQLVLVSADKVLHGYDVEVHQP